MFIVTENYVINGISRGALVKHSEPNRFDSNKEMRIET